MTKTSLLAAVRDELKATLAAIGGRAFVVIQDAQGNADLPVESAPPFVTVADAGLTIEWAPGEAGHAVMRVRIRAYVQDLRGAEAQVLGSDAGDSLGAAAMQDAIVTALQANDLAPRVAGLELSQVESAPAVSLFQGESWTAATGDVLVRYEWTV